MDVKEITPLPPNDDEYEPGMLVRAFSMEIRAKCEAQSDGGSEIEKSLVQNLDTDERRRQNHIRKIKEYLEATRPNELIELNRQMQALQSAVKNFSSSVQKSHPEDISPSLDSWEDVKAVVERMIGRLERKQEKSKLRRVTGNLRIFCNTVQKHSTGLKMLPTGSEYVSVFYGALATVIQASENYTEVMDFLPRSLVEINDAVSAIERRLWLYGGDVMKIYAWRMYGQIFSFLTQLIRWYTKKSLHRFFSSFNEGLLEFFEDQLHEIKKTAKLIREEAHFRQQADTQMNLLYTEGVMERLDRFDRFLLELRESDQRRYDATERRYEDFCARLDATRRSELQSHDVVKDRLTEAFERFLKGTIGQALTDMFEGDARRVIEERGTRQSRALTQDPDQSEDSETAQTFGDLRPQTQPSPAHPGVTRDIILKHAARLERFFDHEKIQMDYASSASFYGDSNIVARMQEWATTTESGVLYIAGTEQTWAWSVAAQYSAIVREAGLPVCSYFCNLCNEDPPEGRSRETMELTALVYCLIRQLIELLPMSMPPTDFQEASFESLEGTLDSFTQALSILDFLLSSTGHTVMVIVIDSLDVLDDTTYGSTKHWLKELVDLLLRHVYREGGGILKILFTSSGTSLPLFEALGGDSILLAEAWDSPRRSRSWRSTEPLVY